MGSQVLPLDPLSSSSLQILNFYTNSRGLPPEGHSIQTPVSQAASGLEPAFSSFTARRILRASDINNGPGQITPDLPRTPNSASEYNLISASYDNLSIFFCGISPMHLIPPRGSLLATGPYHVPAHVYCSFLYASKRCSSRSGHRLCLFVLEWPCSSLQESPLSLLKAGSPSLESSSSPLLDGSTFSNTEAPTPMKQAPAPGRLGQRRFEELVTHGSARL